MYRLYWTAVLLLYIYTISKQSSISFSKQIEPSVCFDSAHSYYKRKKEQDAFISLMSYRHLTFSTRLLSENTLYNPFVSAIHQTNIEASTYTIMKKVKQIIAMVGVIVLLAMYVFTLIVALVGGKSEQTQRLLVASIVCTFIVPVLLWAYSMVYRWVKHSNEKNKNTFINQVRAESEKPSSDQTKKTKKS